MTFNKLVKHIILEQEGTEVPYKVIEIYTTYGECGAVYHIQNNTDIKEALYAFMCDRYKIFDKKLIRKSLSVGDYRTDIACLPLNSKAIFVLAPANKYYANIHDIISDLKENDWRKILKKPTIEEFTNTLSVHNINKIALSNPNNMFDKNFLDELI